MGMYFCAAEWSGQSGPLLEGLTRLRTNCDVEWYSAAEWARDKAGQPAGSVLGLGVTWHLTVRHRDATDAGSFEITGHSLAEAVDLALGEAGSRRWLAAE